MKFIVNKSPNFYFKYIAVFFLFSEIGMRRWFIYIPKVGEVFNSSIYSLLVRFRGPPELGGPGARHRLVLR